MKGGYQILNLSTVTVGTKTKTKGSFEQAKGNNGKPVMVLTPDNQRVFAEVVESSGDYILAYLGGDGSTYTVLVEDDDNVTITKQESDATIATKVATLETAVGDVTDLDTTSKVVVGAINELNSKTSNYGSMIPHNNILYAIVTDLEASYSAAENYTLYSGKTLAGAAGGWYGFKDGEGSPSSAVVLSKNGVYHAMRNTSGTWELYVISSK